MVGDKSIERKVNEITLSKYIITRHTDELSYDVSQQQKDRVHTCSFFSMALSESAAICDAVQLDILRRGSDNNLNIFEEIILLESMQENPEIQTYLRK